ncbi:glycosyltransferase family 2 protein [uncultured Roseibium sp.]|uniref:glycosyltransferase family 2 protein n=1 Tax=uncultured Roseibium sp. TaxID=1936171 RepID=UPI003216D290
MKKDKLVVVFPIYNGEKTMLKSLECIAAQDYRDFRAIIVENRSTDRSLEIAEEFCSRDDRFEVVQNEEHLKVIDNFLKAIEIGSHRGEYFCLRACDDLSTPDYLSKLLNALEEDKSKLLATGSTKRVSPEGERIINPASEVLSFWEHVTSGDKLKGLWFPAEWFYGIYRSNGAPEILKERLPKLRSPWCVASYTVAEFVIRGQVVWVEGPKYIFFEGSASEKVYTAKSLFEKFRQRWDYTIGCYRVLKKMPPLPLRTRRRLFKMFWKDSGWKTRYRLRRHVRGKLKSLVGR